MLYLDSFQFPSGDNEFDFILSIKRQCYDTFYPFKVLSVRRLTHLEFEPITILYGGNGSGKSTALNVIADKLGLLREAVYNRSNFFEDYLRLCSVEGVRKMPADSRIITSDDVFDYMLNIRTLNNGIDYRREELFDEYLEVKNSNFKMKSMKDYEQLKKVNLSRRKTQSKYVTENVIDNVVEKSNGESGYMYFTEKIKENALYLLDEPENSLSPDRQIELVQFIEEATRFFGCQFVISTHSPFLLAIKGAKIYDLDEDPVRVQHWTKLRNVRTYYEFFKDKKNEFE